MTGLEGHGANRLQSVRRRIGLLVRLATALVLTRHPPSPDNIASGRWRVVYLMGVKWLGPTSGFPRDLPSRRLHTVNWNGWPWV